LIKVEGNLRAPEENNNAGGMAIELQRLLAKAYRAYGYAYGLYIFRKKKAKGTVANLYRSFKIEQTVVHL
jgi:hypothetical protein